VPTVLTCCLAVDPPVPAYVKFCPVLSQKAPKTNSSSPDVLSDVVVYADAESAFPAGVKSASCGVDVAIPDICDAIALIACPLPVLVSVTTLPSLPVVLYAANKNTLK